MVSVGIGVPLTYIMLYVLPKGETEEEAEELVYAQLRCAIALLKNLDPNRHLESHERLRDDYVLCKHDDMMT